MHQLLWSNNNVYLVQSYVSVGSQTSRLKLLVEYSLGALRDPLRADLVAAVGDLSSLHVLYQRRINKQYSNNLYMLKDIRRKMITSEEGRQIFLDKPRVNEITWNQQSLLALPENTFGYQYAKWMSKFHFTPEDRTPCKYVPDLELAFIMQRYRETHDAIHVLLNYDVTVAEELAVKWYEMIQLGLPSTALSAFFGPLNLLLVKRDITEVDKLVRVQYRI